MLTKLTQQSNIIASNFIRSISIHSLKKRFFTQTVKKDHLAGPGISSYEEIEKILPKNYTQLLSNKETQIALNECKTFIENSFNKRLNLIRVECPLIVSKESGVNDMLDRDCSRKPVNFFINNDYGKHPINAEIVQAATKWKRIALKTFGLTEPGQGLYTDMRAIRKDYFLDHDHSSYVSQWDWEMTISEKQRNLDFLFKIVRELYSILKDCEEGLLSKYNSLHRAIPKENRLPNDIHFIHCEELYNKYSNNPSMGRKERETAILLEKKAVFLCGIGYPLSNKKDNMPHELRAADYDDWITKAKWPIKTDHYFNEELHGLNGDILIWNNITKRRHELSSMGIRVTKESLIKQLEMSNQIKNIELPYHQCIFTNAIPLSIGGGIGQSRTFMYLLRKAHLGEVEVSVWPKYFIEMCKKYGINVLQ